MNDARPDGLTARTSLSRSALLLVLGVALIAALSAVFRFAPDFYDGVHFKSIHWLGGFALVFLGLSALDRRVRLSIDHRGVFCRDWGPDVIPWGEFERFEIVYRETDRFIVPHLKIGSFPARSRKGAFAEKLALRLILAPPVVLPPGGIDLRPLDVREHVVIQALESHGAQITHAPRVS